MSRLCAEATKDALNTDRAAPECAEQPSVSIGYYLTPNGKYAVAFSPSKQEYTIRERPNTPQYDDAAVNACFSVSAVVMFILGLLMYKHAKRRNHASDS